MKEKLKHLKAISSALVISLTVSGCQHTAMSRLKESMFFGPVDAVFTVSEYGQDKSVEKIISQHLFCGSCPFVRIETTLSPYKLHIHYFRTPDLKSMGKVLLSAGLASFEAEFIYRLKIKLLEKNRLLKEYEYIHVTTGEKTVGVFWAGLNPFFDENGRSEEMFAEMTDLFLLQIQAERPLPQIGRNQGDHQRK